MRPGCLILTATILRSSIKASCRQNHRLALLGIRQSSLAGPEPVQRARYVRGQVVRLLQAIVEANEAFFEIPVRPPEVGKDHPQGRGASPVKAFSKEREIINEGRLLRCRNPRTEDER